MNSSKLGTEVWYLYHSGFAVKTAAHFLIFDYYIDTPGGAERGLAGGVIDPDEIKDLDVLVFVSHRHGDHFNPKIFSWEKSIPKIRYILSHDIRSHRKPKDALAVFPRKKYALDDGIEIRVIRSTDVGVAFLVEVDGITVYHAGDLNWWHWEGEPERDNVLKAKNYKEEINTLKGLHIDIAFVPLDSRLEKQYLWGLDYLMQTVQVKTVFPMHFWDDFSALDRIQKDARAGGYLDKIKLITRRGQKFDL
jgi:L-ascorbate metabolism protein UlaG (beta-lactamase superfamily)